jgi:hypothetical protein
LGRELGGGPVLPLPDIGPVGRLLGESFDDVVGQVGRRVEDHGQFVGSEFWAAGGARAGLQAVHDLSAAGLG